MIYFYLILVDFFILDGKSWTINKIERFLLQLSKTTNEEK